MRPISVRTCNENTDSAVKWRWSGTPDRRARGTLLLYGGCAGPHDRVLLNVQTLMLLLRAGSCILMGSKRRMRHSPVTIVTTGPLLPPVTCACSCGYSVTSWRRTTSRIPVRSASNMWQLSVEINTGSTTVRRSVRLDPAQHSAGLQWCRAPWSRRRVRAMP